VSRSSDERNAGVTCPRVVPHVAALLRATCSRRLAMTAAINSQTANAPPPVFFGRRRVRRLLFPLPPNVRGVECREALNLSRFCEARRAQERCALASRRSAQTSLRSLRKLDCDGVLTSGTGPRFRLGIPAQVVSLLQAGTRSGPERSPGAARVRGCVTTPAGAAPCPTLATPREARPCGESMATR
jgi:hypothetical protein